MTGNRLLRGECLKCGTPLIADFMGNFNEFNCCTSCTEDVKKLLYEASKKKKAQGESEYPLKTADL